MAAKRTIAPYWAVITLTIGIALGAGGAFVYSFFVTQQNAAAEAAAEERELNTNVWFTDDDTLPESATAPGSKLAIGEEATVLVQSSLGKTSVATVTVESIEVFDEADTKLLRNAQPALLGQSLYRINYLVAYQSGEALAGVRFGDAIFPTDDKGNQLLQVPVNGFESCGTAALPDTIDANDEQGTKAQPAKMCAVAASPEGAAPVAGAFFAQPGGPYALAIKGQITWLP